MALALAAPAFLAMGLVAPSALAVRTTISFTEGQLRFGGGPGANPNVDQRQPVRIGADFADTGYFDFSPDDFDFPPVTAQIAPGQQATLDLIPEGVVSGEFVRTSGELKTDGASFTLRAELSGGGSCQASHISLRLSTATEEPFAGDPFDPGSFPPTNGAIAGEWDDIPASGGGLQCAAFNQFTSGEGGIRLANASGGPEGGELSVEVSTKHIGFGDEVTIRGRLSGVPSGSGGHQVELIERPYPYDEPSERRPKVITGEDGSYKFKVEPQFNTRYVVRDTSGSGAESQEITVWVWENGRDLDIQVVRHRGGPHVKASWTLRFGEELETDYTDRRMFWYFRKKGERKMTLKDRTRIRQKPGQINSRTFFGIPSRNRYRFYVYPCFDEPRGDDGTGRPGSNRCPRKKHPTFADFG